MNDRIQDHERGDRRPRPGRGARVLPCALLVLIGIPLGGCEAWFDLLEPFSTSPSPGALPERSDRGTVYTDEWRPVHARPAPTPRSRPREGVLITPKGDPWTMLSSGCAREAMCMFDREVRRCPGVGLPVVGYALAAAGTGDLERGARAMRIAITLDPHALRYVPVDRRLHRELESMAAVYHECAGHRLESDPLLMLAALYYLMDDMDSAHSAVTLCCRVEGRSSAVRSLHTIIEREIVRRDPCDRPLIHAHVEISRSSRDTPRTERRPSTTAPEPPVEDVARPRAQWPPPGLIGPADELPSDELPAVPSADASSPPAEPDDSLFASAAVTQQAPSVEAPMEPIEPVDYDRLRSEINDASDSLDRFTQKLLDSMNDRSRSLGSRR